MRCNVLVSFALVSLLGSLACADEPLPSWNDTASKKAIVAFVESVTRESSPNFVPPAERIAVFDNDGTLWAEQPFYTQLAFALYRMKQMAPEHPEWQDEEPYKSLLAGDLSALFDGGPEAVAGLVLTTHANLSSSEFRS